MAKGTYTVSAGSSSAKEGLLKSGFCAILVIVAICLIVLLTRILWTREGEKAKESEQSAESSGEEALHITTLQTTYEDSTTDDTYISPTSHSPLLPLTTPPIEITTEAATSVETQPTVVYKAETSTTEINAITGVKTTTSDLYFSEIRTTTEGAVRKETTTVVAATEGTISGLTREVTTTEKLLDKVWKPSTESSVASNFATESTVEITTADTKTEVPQGTDSTVTEENILPGIVGNSTTEKSFPVQTEAASTTEEIATQSTVEITTKDTTTEVLQGTDKTATEENIHPGIVGNLTTEKSFPVQTEAASSTEEITTQSTVEITAKDTKTEVLQGTDSTVTEENILPGIVGNLTTEKSFPVQTEAASTTEEITTQSTAEVTTKDTKTEVLRGTDKTVTEESILPGIVGNLTTEKSFPVQTVAASATEEITTQSTAEITTKDTKTEVLQGTDNPVTEQNTLPGFIENLTTEKSFPVQTVAASATEEVTTQTTVEITTKDTKTEVLQGTDNTVTEENTLPGFIENLTTVKLFPVQTEGTSTAEEITTQSTVEITTKDTKTEVPQGTDKAVSEENTLPGFVENLTTEKSLPVQTVAASTTEEITIQSTVEITTKDTKTEVLQGTDKTVTEENTLVGPIVPITDLLTTTKSSFDETTTVKPVDKAPTTLTESDATTKKSVDIFVPPPTEKGTTISGSTEYTEAESAEESTTKSLSDFYTHLIEQPTTPLPSGESITTLHSVITSLDDESATLGPSTTTESSFIFVTEEATKTETMQSLDLTKGSGELWSSTESSSFQETTEENEVEKPPLVPLTERTTAEGETATDEITTVSITIPVTESSDVPETKTEVGLTTLEETATDLSLEKAARHLPVLPTLKTTTTEDSTSADPPVTEETPTINSVLPTTEEVQTTTKKQVVYIKEVLPTTFGGNTTASDKEPPSPIPTTPMALLTSISPEESTEPLSSSTERADSEEDSTKIRMSSRIDSECTLPECKAGASKMLSLIDHSKDPCEDFYGFACGGMEVEEMETLVWKVIEEQLDRINEDSPYHLRVFKDLYNSCVDYQQVFNYKERVKGAQELLKDVGQLEPGKTRDITKLMAKLILRQSCPIVDFHLVNESLDFRIHMTVPTVSMPLLKQNERRPALTAAQERCLDEQYWKLRRENLNLTETYEHYRQCQQDYTIYLNSVENAVRELHLFGDVDESTLSEYLTQLKYTVEEILETVHEYPQTYAKRQTAYAYNISYLEENFGCLQWRQLLTLLTGSQNEMPDVYIRSESDFRTIFQKLSSITEWKISNALIAMYAHDLFENFVLLHSNQPREYCLKTSSFLFHDVALDMYLQDSNKKMNPDQATTWNELKEKMGQNIQKAEWLESNLKATLVGSLKDLKQANPVAANYKRGDIEIRCADVVIKGEFPVNAINMIARSQRNQFQYHSENRFEFLYTNPYDKLSASYSGKNIGKSTIENGPKYVLFAQQGLSLAREIGAFIFDKFPESVTQYGHIQGSDVLVNNTRMIAGQKVTYVVDPALSAREVFIDNIAFKLLSDCLDDIKDQALLPWVSATFSREKLFVLATMQGYCQNPDMPDFMLELFEGNILPARLLVENMVTNSDFVSETFRCAEGSAMNDNIYKNQFPFRTSIDFSN